MATFSGGTNIALKVPPHQVAATVRFYGEVLGLPRAEDVGEAIAFRFGHCTLWIDAVPTLSQAEIWLELRTDDTAGAAEALGTAGIVRCDGVEPLPPGLDAFWIASPCGIVHLVDGTAPGGGAVSVTPDEETDPRRGGPRPLSR